MRYSARGYIGLAKARCRCKLGNWESTWVSSQDYNTNQWNVSVFPKNMEWPWQTDPYLFLCHFYRYEKARDVPLVFVSYLSTWSYVGIKKILVGSNGFRYQINLWIFWIISSVDFSDFLKILLTSRNMIPSLTIGSSKRNRNPHHTRVIISS